MADTGSGRESGLLSDKLTNGVVGGLLFLLDPKKVVARPITHEIFSESSSKPSSNAGRLCSDDITPSDLSSVDGADEVIVDASLPESPSALSKLGLSLGVP